MRPQVFLEWDRSRIAREINAIRGVPERDRERGALALRLYQLLCKKYNPQHVDLIRDLEKAYLFDPAQLRSLEGSLKSKNYRRALEIVLDFLTVLKQKILSPGKTHVFGEHLLQEAHRRRNPFHVRDLQGGEIRGGRPFAETGEPGRPSFSSGSRSPSISSSSREAPSPGYISASGST